MPGLLFPHVDMPEFVPVQRFNLGMYHFSKTNQNIFPPASHWNFLYVNIGFEYVRGVTHMLRTEGKLYASEHF